MKRLTWLAMELAAAADETGTITPCWPGDENGIARGV
jgi:hypothetical protein